MGIRDHEVYRFEVTRTNVPVREFIAHDETRDTGARVEDAKIVNIMAPSEIIARAWLASRIKYWPGDLYTTTLIESFRLDSAIIEQVW